jgi:hypothetical protein
MNLRLIRLVVCSFAFSLMTMGEANATAHGFDQYTMRGAYEGILPCSDCGGVWAKLILNDNGLNGGEGKGTFVMTERFTGGVRGGATVTIRGNWIEAGTTSGMAYIGNVELLPATSEGKTPAPITFFCDQGRYLRLLIEDSPDYAFALGRSRFPVLQRVFSHPQFGPLIASDNPTNVFARVGDEFTIELPARSIETTLTAWVPETSPGVLVIGVYGSGNGASFFSDFTATAAKPGHFIVNFRSAENPRRTVTFSFEIAP